MKNDLSFPRHQRLVTKAEFKSLFDESTKASQRYLLALYKPNNGTNSRLGVIVAKKVAKLAVTRNLIKRVVRESYRTYQDQLSGLDIVVIARHQCGSLDRVQLREGIEKLWQKLLTQYQKSSS